MSKKNELNNREICKIIFDTMGEIDPKSVEGINFLDAVKDMDQNAAKNDDEWKLMSGLIKGGYKKGLEDKKEESQ